MVRGNWQKRVETAEARRRQTRERKQRSENARQQKERASAFLALLDRACSNRKTTGDDDPPIVLQFDCWSDSPPPESENPHDSSKKDNQDRSELRVAGPSRGLKKVSKKLHPRSSEASSKAEVSDSWKKTNVMMCRSFFFSGKCPSLGKKKGGCPFLHEIRPLRDALLNSGGASKSISCTAETQKQLNDAQLALGEDVESPGGMEVLNHISFDMQVPSLNARDRRESEDLKDFLPSDHLVKSFSIRRMRFSDVVYIVCNNTIIFDRHRAGSLLKPEDVLVLGQDEKVGGDVVKVRKPSIGNDDKVGPVWLPGAILEHCLAYLPDSAVVACNLVCKSWYREIGSANMWKEMLIRRGWFNSSSESATTDAFRDIFLSHYSVLRDCIALSHGLSALIEERPVSPQMEREVVVRKPYSTKKLIVESEPAELRLWGPNRVIVSSHSDFWANIFGVVAGNHGEMACRQLVDVNYAPTRHVKVADYYENSERDVIPRPVCTDGDYVIWLCTSRTLVPRETCLVWCQRDDVLECDKNMLGDSLGFIDLRQCVNTYLSSLDPEAAGWDGLDEVRVASNGALSDLAVEARTRPHACGGGLFMIECAISAPEDLSANNDTPWETRKMFLFSIHTGDIIWQGDSFPEEGTMCPLSKNIVTTSSPLLQSRLDGFCSVVVVSRSEFVLVLEVSPNGSVVPTRLRFATHDPDGRDDDHTRISDRKVLLSTTDVVVVDILHSENHENPIHSAKLSFYPRSQSPPPSQYSIDGVSAGKFHAAMVVRRNYLVLFFAEDTGVILHVPSRIEIGRFEWPGERSVSSLLEYAEETLSVTFARNGIVLTGRDIRSAIEDSSSKLSAKISDSKIKRKRRVSRGSKKDGFARGMSLRG